jgi:hypothetical protein
VFIFLRQIVCILQKLLDFDYGESDDEDERGHQQGYVDKFFFLVIDPILLQ